MKTTPRLLAALALGLLLGIPGLAAAQFDFTTVDVPGAVRTSAFFVNAQGQVAGVYRDAANVSHGFVWTNGDFTAIDVPGATLTSVIGINDHGQVAGVYGDTAGNLHGFVLSQGVYTT